MASMSIHGVTGDGLRTPVADIVEDIYIVVIVITIGLMVLHWLLDLGRQILSLVRSTPRVQRMKSHEVWQHTFLMVSFVLLVISGFALRFSNGWLAQTFFGWDGGFEFRGVLHRYAAVLFMATVVWHVVFVVASARGRQFFNDMRPGLEDVKQLYHRILYNLGRSKEHPRFGRFSYVEKAEYWALIWGTVIMVFTGILLWFDNWFIQYLPKGVLDVGLVIHYWEAWLATLAIFVWHLYSTVFNPTIYPMNPAWLTGYMPEKMYREEHPEHLKQAIREEKKELEKELDELAQVNTRRKNSE
jgi:formate dehydrogenase gamma subunit